jgi:hypothetical protein
MSTCVQVHYYNTGEELALFVTAVADVASSVAESPQLKALASM